MVSFGGGGHRLALPVRVRFAERDPPATIAHVAGIANPQLDRGRAVDPRHNVGHVADSRLDPGGGPDPGQDRLLR